MSRETELAVIRGVARWWNSKRVGPEATKLLSELCTLYEKHRRSLKKSDDHRAVARALNKRHP